MIKTNHNAVERIFPEDERVKPQTVSHHKARYIFAAMAREKRGLALDVGCGTGYGAEFLRLAGYKVIGIDVSKKAVTYAKKHYPLVRFINKQIQQFNFGSYDLITMFEVLEHLDDIVGVETIIKCSCSLKKKGKFILSIPRRSNKKYNKFHASEWDFVKLKEILEFNFHKAKIYGQDWDSGLVSERKVINNDFFLAVCSND